MYSLKNWWRKQKEAAALWREKYLESLAQTLNSLDNEELIDEVCSHLNGRNITTKDEWVVMRKALLSRMGTSESLFESEKDIHP